MFIYNFKVNGKLISKIIFVIIGLIVSAYFLISAWKIYTSSFRVKDELNNKNLIDVTADNYTNVLKNVHENIDEYVGKEVCFTGYVYRMYDFTDNQFVLARDMVISQDNKSLVVGFLCDYKKIKDYDNNSWIEITGEITKGNYHGEIPVIKVKKIKLIAKPENKINVFPPDSLSINNK